jgi:hypothetical protein
MVNHVLRVFVSSRSDLPEERRAAFEVILAAGHEPDQYENWPALSQRPLDASIAAVKGDDILVLLLGETYGALADTGRSITHEEYRAAREKNIPVLAFRIGSRDPESRQAEFIAEVELHETIGEVASIDALRSELKRALSVEVARGYREPRDAPLDMQLRPSGMPAERRMAITIDAQAEVIDKLKGAVTRHAAEKLNTARSIFREGRPDDAIAAIDELQKGAEWSQIDRDVRARGLTTLASFRRATGSTAAEVEPLLQEAKKLDPEADYSYFEALQRLDGEDALRALESLTIVRNTRALNFKAALLLEEGRTDEAAQLLEHPPDGIESDIETQRLRAFVSLARGDTEAAIRLLQEALTREPKSFSLRFALAIVKIASTIAVPERPRQPVVWLAPIDPTFVVTTPDMLARLDDAAAAISELLDNTQWAGTLIEQARTWRLAALALHPERRAAARAFAHQLLDLDPADAAALVWSSAYGFDVDLDKAEAALSTETTSSSTSRLIAVIAAIELAGDIRRAESLLASHRAAFDDNAALWEFWNARLLIDQGQLEQAKTLIPRIEHAELRQTCELMLAESHAKATGEWNDFLQLADHIDPGYRPLAIRARLGRWAEVVDHAVRSADEAPSPASVGLAARALFHVRRNAESLAMLDRHRGIWSQSANATQLQRLEIRNRLVVGQLLEALKSAEQLFQRSGSTTDLIATIHAAISAGRWQDARFWASRLNDGEPSAVDGADTLQIARMIMSEDRDLARDLWKRAKTSGITDELLLLAIPLAMSLGLVAEAKELTDSAMTKGILRQPTAEKFAELKANVNEATRAYTRGEMPLAVLLALMNRSLADLFDNQLSIGEAGSVGSVPPLYTRHGGRMMSHHVSLEGISALTLDLSTILLSDNLGVLDRIEKRFDTLRISSVTCAALAEQESRIQGIIATRPDSVETHRLERLAVRLSKLAARISAGLSAGKYVAFRTAGPSSDEDADFDLTSQALADLALDVDQEKRAFVIDDRFTNSWLKMHDSIVVTLPHILASLRRGGHLGDEEYFLILLRLRRANFRFIDLDGDEIVHWLTNATWRDGVLEESEPMQILRVYLNGALSDPNLRVIPIPESTPARALGEGPFAMNSSWAPVRALATLWSFTDLTIAQRTAMSDWIVQNLYTGTYGVQHLYGGFTATRELMVHDIASLLTMLFDLDLDLDTGRAFADWVQTRIAAHRRDADPGLNPDLIIAIKHQLSLVLTAAADPDFCRRAIRAVFSVLPSDLRKEIASDVDFAAKVQLRGRPSIHIAGFDFLADHFWDSVARLRKRPTVRLKTTAGERVTVSRMPGDTGLFFDLGRDRRVFPDETFVTLALKTDDEIRNHLSAHPEIFDIDDEALDLAIRELLALRPLRARSERYREWKAMSAAARYADLRELFNQANYTFADLMPAPDAILRHYFPGYKTGGDFDAAAAFAPLIERADLLDVLRRAVVIPIALPAQLLARFTSETDVRRRQILTELRGDAGSPVARAHVAVLGFASGTEADRNLALAMVDELAGLNEEASQRTLFMTVLRFVYWRLSRTSSFPDAVRLLLAWAHAGRLLGIFVATQCNVDELQQSFVDAGMSYPDDYCTRGAASQDVLHPFTATGQRTIAAALAHVATVISGSGDALEVSSRLAKVVYPNGVGIPFPFLHDVSLGTNVCHSFLDSDLSATLFEVDKTGAALLTNEAKDEILTRAMLAIDNSPGSVVGWQHIPAIVGNLPPPTNVREWLEDLVRGSKLEAIALSDGAIDAFVALADLQSHFGDEYRGRVEDQAVAAATNWQSRERDSKSVRYDINRWAFVAIALAARPASHEDTGNALGRIFRRFIDAAPRMAPMLSELVSRMPFQLPMKYLLPLWPAVIAVRAMPRTTVSEAAYERS